MAKQKLGQNFLHDKKIAARIVNTVSGSGGIIMEIGPGRGIMTEILAASPLPKRIIAVEKDPVLYQNLIKKDLPGIELVNNDILEISLQDVTVGENITILGNIPYNISKEIIDWIIYGQNYIQKGTLMVQKEFFQKITSTPGTKIVNAQSVIFNHIFDCTKRFEVKPGSFTPIPKIVSVVFSFEHKLQDFNGGDIPLYYDFLKTAFSQRRKTLINTLGNSYKKITIRNFLEASNLPLNTRAEDTTPETLRKLYFQLDQSCDIPY